MIDAAKLEAVKTIKIGDGNKQAHGFWFSPDGKYFYAVASADGALVKIDVAKQAVASRMAVGPNGSSGPAGSGTAQPDRAPQHPLGQGSGIAGLDAA